MTHTFTKLEDIVVLRAEKLQAEYENRRILEEVDEFLLDEYNKFIIDLEETKYLSSAGFSFLIAVLTKSRNAGGETVIVNVNEKVSKLLVVMKLRKVFTILASIEEAVEFLINDANDQEEE